MKCAKCGGKMVQLMISAVCANACERAEKVSDPAYPYLGYCALVQDDLDRMCNKSGNRDGTGLWCNVHKSPEYAISTLSSKIYTIHLNKEIDKISPARSAIFLKKEDVEKKAGIISRYLLDSNGKGLIGIVGKEYEA